MSRIPWLASIWTPRDRLRSSKSFGSEPNMSDPYGPIVETLNRAQRVLVTTHVRPDGDALGSTAAMILGLRAKGIEAEALLLSHLPSKYAFAFEANGIVYHGVENGWPDPFPLDRFDCLLVVDTGT